MMQRESISNARNLATKTQSKYKLPLTIPAKVNLTGEESELYELATLADVHFDPRVFKIILDLLQLNVSPTAIMEMLKCMSTSSYQGKIPPLTTQGDNLVKQNTYKKR